MYKFLIPLALTASPLIAQENDEVALAKATLEALQATSFSANREYCGYIVIDANGDLMATPAVQGNIGDCEAAEPPEDSVPLASYHTHGAFEYDTPAEFPSVGDLEADEAEGVDGYISTPGGRLWYVDGVDQIASQLCGVGCLSQDPNFEAGLDGDLQISYTIDELRALEAE
jgi:hypothetical protein